MLQFSLSVFLFLICITHSLGFLFCLHEEVRGNEKVEALFFKLPVSNFALSVLKAWVEK